jgi:hypothetical protein
MEWEEGKDGFGELLADCPWPVTHKLGKRKEMSVIRGVAGRTVSVAEEQEDFYQNSRCVSRPCLAMA